MTARTDLAERILTEFMRPEHAPLNDHGVGPDGGPECVRCPVPAYAVKTPEELSEAITDAVAEWLMGDAAVETAARSFFGGADWVWQHPSLGDENQRKRDSARAALSAVLRATEGNEE